MTAAGWVARQVVYWTLLVATLAAGLIWTAGAVEAAELDLGGALRSGFNGLPIVWVQLVPVLAALGAGLARTRMDSTGETHALEACGVDPSRLAGAAALAGLGLGLLGGAIQATMVPGLANASAQGTAWWWTPDAARRDDGWIVRSTDGHLAVERDESDSFDHDLGRALARPSEAAWAALGRAETLPARAERSLRLARAWSTLWWAAVAWLPWGRRTGAHLPWVLGLVLGWELLDRMALGATLDGVLPTTVGPWVGGLLLAVVGIVRLTRSGKPAYSFISRTRSQPPV